MNPKLPKNKYYFIALYSLAVITIGTLIIKIIMNWSSTALFFSSVMHVLYPFLMGILIAYFINPLAIKINCDMLKPLLKGKYQKPRKIIAILLSYILVIGAIVTIMFYIVPQVVDSFKQISSLIHTAQSGFDKLMEHLYALDKKYPQWDLSTINNAINKIPDTLMKLLSQEIPRLIPTIYTTSMSLISGILNMVIALIVSIYMLADKNKLLNNCKRIIYAIFGAKTGDKILDYASECNRIFGRFIIGKMIDSLIIGILCFLLMSILKLPYAVMISVIVGVTNMIPYFGPFIGAIPGVFFLLVVDIKYGLIFIVLIFLLQQFDGLYLGPKILGESTGLGPLWIIFAITVGGSVAGVLGMFLGVPTLAVFAFILNRILEKRLTKKKIDFETDPNTGIMSRIEQKSLPAKKNGEVTALTTIKKEN